MSGVRAVLSPIPAWAVSSYPNYQCLPGCVKYKCSRAVLLLFRLHWCLHTRRFARIVFDLFERTIGLVHRPSLESRFHLKPIVASEYARWEVRTARFTRNAMTGHTVPDICGTHAGRRQPRRLNRTRSWRAHRAALRQPSPTCSSGTHGCRVMGPKNEPRYPAPPPLPWSVPARLC